MSPTPEATGVAQLLQGGAVPGNVNNPLQLLPESQVHRIDNSPLPLPTVQAMCSQVLGDNPPHLQLDRSGGCPHCSRLWLTHSECIFEAGIIIQDGKENAH